MLIQKRAATHLSTIFHPAGCTPYRREGVEVWAIALQRLDDWNHIFLVASNREVLHPHIALCVVVVIKLSCIVACATVKSYNREVVALFCKYLLEERVSLVLINLREQPAGGIGHRHANAEKVVHRLGCIEVDSLVVGVGVFCEWRTAHFVN